jgi:predicted membrane protein
LRTLAFVVAFVITVVVVWAIAAPNFPEESFMAVFFAPLIGLVVGGLAAFLVGWFQRQP